MGTRDPNETEEGYECIVDVYIRTHSSGAEMMVLMGTASRGSTSNMLNHSPT